jgi:hypothetical protein
MHDTALMLRYDATLTTRVLSCPQAPGEGQHLRAQAAAATTPGSFGVMRFISDSRVETAARAPVGLGDVGVFSV